MNWSGHAADKAVPKKRLEGKHCNRPLPALALGRLPELRHVGTAQRLACKAGRARRPRAGDRPVDGGGYRCSTGPGAASLWSEVTKPSVTARTGGTAGPPARRQEKGFKRAIHSTDR